MFQQRGVSSFVLRVISDALLIVDKQQFLFANKSFEDLCDYAAYQLVATPSLLLEDEIERRAFFKLIDDHLSGKKDVFNESIVECHNKSSGLFLAQVTFHAFLDELDDSKPKCVCIFSEPMFLKSLFTNATTLFGLLEYRDEEGDCIMLKTNEALLRILFSFLDVTNKPYQPWSSSTLFSLNKRLVADLGFILEEDDLEFFDRCRLQSTPRMKCFRVQPRQKQKQQPLQQPLAQPTTCLGATLTYLGRSLNGRSLFAFVAEDVTRIQGLESQIQDGKQQLQAQSAFFSKMIHELRTPLTGLLGMTSLLRNTVLKPEQTECLSTIEVCGDSVLSLVGNLLDLANLERNQIVLANEPFSLLECIEQALDIVALQAAAKDIELMYELGPSTCVTRTVKGDIIRVRQVLLNLLSNAIKFTNKNGHVIVRMGLEQIDVYTVLATFAVADDGIGIAEEDQLNIFKVYTQASTSITQRYGGSGLGLTIVKSLVDIMQGTVRVESSLGRGSTFYATMQLHTVPPGLLFLAKRKSASSVPQKQDLDLIPILHNKTAVLLLSDQNLVMNLASRLGALGMKHLDTASASALLNTTSAGGGGGGDQRPDVIFCGDTNQMLAPPYTYECIRNMAKAANIPVITVAWQLSRRSADAAGDVNTYFLRKPIREQQLFEVLCKVFHLASLAPPVSTEESLAGANQQLKRQCIAISSVYLRILVVDDNIVNRKIMQRMLETIGCAKTSIYTAGNGLEAIDALQQQMADVILMDLEMPIMNGSDATREIRKRWTTQPYIIAVTASATEQAKDACLQAGMDGFLSKPVRLDTLAEAIQQAISREFL